MHAITVRTRSGKFQQSISNGRHALVADEAVDLGGEDAGPAPLELLLAALGACTSMTLKLYADRKGWPLEAVEVELSQAKATDHHEIRRAIRLVGPLTDDQRARLLEIANKCPVHNVLRGPTRIESALV
jgi:putative redox protein